MKLDISGLPVKIQEQVLRALVNRSSPHEVTCDRFAAAAIYETTEDFFKNGIDLTLRNGDAVTDAEMLDYLDSLPRGMEAGWKVRPSTTGRGWRLLTTRETPNYPTVREAIRAFHDEREEGGVWCLVELGREGGRS